MPKPLPKVSKLSPGLQPDEAVKVTYNELNEVFNKINAIIAKLEEIEGRLPQNQNR